MKIGNLTVEGRLWLAPLAGISNRPFRLLAGRYGAGICFTEMISADAVAREQRRTLAMIDIAPDEHPVGIQLFGSRPEYFAYAVRRVMEFEPDLIDLNFGCPVPKVIKKNGGAALLKDLPRAKEIMIAAVENSRVPITVKIRSGWNADEDVYLELGRQAEEIGAAAITLHPRSRTQNYSIKADWSKIGLLKRTVGIPVIGNGDIMNGPDAKRMFDQTGCDAVMIGRAAMKNPYVLLQIKTYLKNGKILPEMAIPERVALALDHTRLMCNHYGDQIGIKKMRKHLIWYTKGLPEGGRLRSQLMRVEKPAEINKILGGYIT